MKNKYLFVTVLLLCLALLGFGFTRSYVKMEGQRGEEELLVVTSFYPVYVAALNVAGDCPGVRIENLSEPQTGCLHDYQLTPQDMILLSQADIFVVNGGGIEGFLTEVAKEYPNLAIINAGEGMFEQETEDFHQEEDQEEHHHEQNAHVWMSIPRYMEQIAAIRDGLIAADNSHQKEYEGNAAEYLKKIELLRQEAEEVSKIAQGEKIVILHQAFAFFAEDFHMQVRGELNLDEERQVSAGEIADILSAVKKENIKILLAEDLYGKDMGDTIERETDCKVYYLDTLVRGDEDKDSWLKGMENNIQILKKALRAEASAEQNGTVRK